MKKLYFLLASLLAFSAAQAQTFVFNYNDKPVEGETLVCDASDATLEEFDGEYDVTIAPKISVTATNLGDLEGMFGAKLDIKSLNGQVVQCCGVDGACKTGTEIQKDMQFDTDGLLNIDLELEYFGYGVSMETIKNVKVLLTVTDEFDANNKASLTVVMYGGDTGVSVIENNKHFQTAQGGFSYDLPAGAVVTLYNAGGAVCGKYTLDGSGFLSAEGMSAGIYFFTVEGEGISESGKVAI